MRTQRRSLIEGPVLLVLLTLLAATTLHAEPATDQSGPLAPAPPIAVGLARADSGAWLCGGGSRAASPAARSAVSWKSPIEADMTRALELVELAAHVGGLTNRALALATAFEEGSSVRELTKLAAPIARDTVRVVVELLKLKIASKI